MKLLLLLLLSHNAYAATFPQYLHLEGEMPKAAAPDILQKLITTFVTPLNADGTISRHSYSIRVNGPRNHFFINLILEPINEGASDRFNRYIAALHGETLFGQTIAFQKVAFISEIARLQIGEYDPDSHDVFIEKFSYPKAVQFRSVNAWYDFSNEFGFALMSTDHEKFKSYINSFIQDAPNPASIHELLTQNNMLAIQSDISVVLDNGQVIPQVDTVSPFLPFRFFRNCFEVKFEAGTCYP